MKIDTRDFGEVEIDENEIITFKQPIFGFEENTRYVFLFEQGISDHFVWLQSVEEKDLCFILVNPTAVVKDYAPELPEQVKLMLGEEECVWWLITVIPEVFQNSTVNLKSPVIVNPSRKCAAQVILEDDLPIRYPLTSEKGDSE